MTSKVSNKTLFLVWTASVLLYLSCVWILDISFNLLVVSGLTNLCLFPLIMRKNGPLKIENPVEYVYFNKGNLLMGELKIPIVNIKKVALDSIGDDAYFSMPYNHIASVGVPSFVFPAEKIDIFKSHLIANIQEVEFVT
ncbi:hypothetical protein RGL42_002694 [Vibrio parahaemolyticus]|nr:hypothetical protein [Vibrio parahaemolyticus]ELA8111173.1 hypothetical protein [Vibrio parahaemolyticus]ELA8164905.1 hypothetical protein [Vibrio parahaemolyticus]